MKNTGRYRKLLEKTYLLKRTHIHTTTRLDLCSKFHYQHIVTHRHHPCIARIFPSIITCL